MTEPLVPVEGLTSAVGQLAEEHVDVRSATASRGVAASFVRLGAGEAASRIVAFAGTVIIARKLGADMYGVVAFAASVLLYLTRVADLGYDLGLGVREAAQRGDAVLRDIPGMLAGRVAVGLVVGLVTAGAALLLMPSPDGLVLALYTGVLLTTGLGTRWVQIGRGNAGRVAVGRLVGELAALALLLLLVHGPANVLRVPAAQIAGEALTAVILLAWLRGDGLRLLGRPDFSRFRALMPGGLHMVASSLLGLAIYNADLVFLRFFRDSAVVGYYAAAYTFVSFCLNIGITFSVSVLSALSKERADAELRRQVYHRAIAQAFAVTLPVAVGTWFIGREVVGLVFGPKYAETAPILRILILTVPIAVVAETVIATVLADGGERLILRLTMFGAMLVLTLNLLLIPRYGWQGAVLATMIAESMRCIIAMLIARHLGFPLVPLQRLWRPIVAALGMALALYLLALPMPLAIGVGALTYALFLTLTGGLRWRRGSIPELAV